MDVIQSPDLTESFSPLSSQGCVLESTAPCPKCVNQQLIRPTAEVEQPPECKVKNTRALFFLALYTWFMRMAGITAYRYLTSYLPLADHTRYSKLQTDYKPVIDKN